MSTAWFILSALYSLNLSPCRAQANAGRVPGPARLAAVTDGCRAAGRRPTLAGRDGRRRQLWQRRRVECSLHPHRNTVPTLSSFPNVTRVLSTHDSIVYLQIYPIDIYIISTQWWTWAWDKWDTGSKETLTKWYLPSWILSSELRSCSLQSIMVRVGLTDLFESFTGIRVEILWYHM